MLPLLSEGSPWVLYHPLLLLPEAVGCILFGVTAASLAMTRASMRRGKGKEEPSERLLCQQLLSKKTISSKTTQSKMSRWHWQLLLSSTWAFLSCWCSRINSFMGCCYWFTAGCQQHQASLSCHILQTLVWTDWIGGQKDEAGKHFWMRKQSWVCHSIGMREKNKWGFFGSC